jgi:hypothetical protein
MFEKIGVARKKTFTYSEKREEGREAFLNRIAGFLRKSGYALGDVFNVNAGGRCAAQRLGASSGVIIFIFMAHLYVKG